MIFPGVDLGTTFSMIAHVNNYGQPALFPDLHDPSQFRTPSALYVGSLGCLVGAAAEDLLEEGAEVELCRFPKSLLARPDYRHLDHLGREWNAVGLSALLLRKLANDANAFSGHDLGPGVLTVPAQFNDEQRRATLAAADVAGLRGLQLIEEPVAAAAFYGQIEGPADRTLLVFDFGGGTFDVSLLQSSGEGLYVLSCDGDPDLGGRRIDEAVMDLVDHDFRARFGESLLADPISAQRLRRVCEEAKISLSRPAAGQVRKPLMLLGRPYEFALTRAALDEIVNPAVSRAMAACERCLAAAGLSWGDVDKIMLTGGSSSLPAVSEALRVAAGQDGAALVTRQPHLAVAFGAAILAGRFEQDGAAQNRLRPVSTADIALRIWDETAQADRLEVLIPRNTPLPAKHVRLVYTSRPDQAQISFEFAQRRGEPPQTSPLGRFTFGPIPSPRAHYPVELVVTCTREGLVQVTTTDSGTGAAMRLILRDSEVGGFDVDGQRRLVESVEVGLP